MAMTLHRLREIYGPAMQKALDKELDYLDPHCGEFIAHSPFLILGTSDGIQVDLSPKGDPAGFVKVLGERKLVIPDRPGNGRIDGLMNILQHPDVSILFLIPKVNETLRVFGRAEISEDETLRAQTTCEGKVPKTVTIIHVDKAFLHCGKAPIRSGLWQPESWPETRPIQSAGNIFRDHIGASGPDVPQEAVDAALKKKLY